MLMGKVHMVFPEEVCFTNDRNTISLQYVGANNEAVGGSFTFTNEQGVTANIAYNSEQTFLLFNLLSTLKKLSVNDNYSIITVTGTVICGESATNIHPFTLKCIDGRTLHSRPHNSEKIIYWYEPEDLIGIEFLSLYGGVINGFTVQSGITKMNLQPYSSDFQIVQVDGDTQRIINFKKSGLGGDASYETGCDDDDEGGLGSSSNGGIFHVRYMNTDGCFRHLVGKITKRKRSVGYTSWRADELVRHTPNGMINTTTDDITVGFPAVARESYAEDIMFSSVIQYKNLVGEWEPCILSDKSLQLPNWDENDIELTFNILA